MSVHSPLRPGTLVGLLLTGMFAGACLGGLCNAVNGAVSPDYFRAVMPWDDVKDVWRASIAEGLFEGLLFGVAMGLFFAAVVGLMTKAACSYGFAIRYFLPVAVGAAIGWGLGGAVGVGLASLSPEFFRHGFRGVPAEHAPMLRYAWVGGSIMGLQLGGLATVVLALVLLRTRWRQMQADERHP